MTREEVTSAIRAAKTAKKLTWQEIATLNGKVDPNGFAKGFSKSGFDGVSRP